MHSNNYIYSSRGKTLVNDGNYVDGPGVLLYRQNESHINFLEFHLCVTHDYLTEVTKHIQGVNSQGECVVYIYM